jgi:hypothetical protein
MTQKPDPKVIGSLLASEDSQEAFIESIDNLITRMRDALRINQVSEVRQWVDREATSMQMIADALRKTRPDVARFIDNAREKLLKILD